MGNQEAPGRVLRVLSHSAILLSINISNPNFFGKEKKFMERVLAVLALVASCPLFMGCSDVTGSTEKDSPTGVWRATSGSEFNYLVLFEDNTFLYAENDLTALSPEENGLEVGTYSSDSAAETIRFNINYDDNDPGNDSGVGDIGPAVVIDAVVSNGGATLTLADGALALASVSQDSSTPFVGVWRATIGAEFNYLILFEDNTFLYAENDLTVISPEENGLEVGTYFFDPGSESISFDITYDDNDPGNDSGIGDIGTLVAATILLSNGDTTMTVGGGILVLTKGF